MLYVVYGTLTVSASNGGSERASGVGVKQSLTRLTRHASPHSTVHIRFICVRRMLRMVIDLSVRDGYKYHTTFRQARDRNPPPLCPHNTRVPKSILIIMEVDLRTLQRRVVFAKRVH